MSSFNSKWIRTFVCVIPNHKKLRLELICPTFNLTNTVKTTLKVSLAPIKFRRSKGYQDMSFFLSYLSFFQAAIVSPW